MINLTIRRIEVIRLFTVAFYLFRPPERILQVSRFPLDLHIILPVHICILLLRFAIDLVHEGAFARSRYRGAAPLRMESS